MKSMILQIRMRPPTMEWLENEAVKRGFSKSEYARHLIDREVDRYRSGIEPLSESARTEMVLKVQAAEPEPLLARVERSDKKVEKVDQPLSVSERMRRMREG